jgi:DNA-binding IclR family transcriptional regulator
VPLQQLHSEIGANVNVASYVGASIVYRRVNLVSGKQSAEALWSMLPSHATALGKVLLATRSQSEVRRVYEYMPLSRYTPHTIGDLSELEGELGAVGKRGYAVSEGELSDDILCVAVPVQTRNKNCMLALSTCRVGGEAGAMNMERLVDAMKHTAAVIESTLEIAGQRFESDAMA